MLVLLEIIDHYENESTGRWLGKVVNSGFAVVSDEARLPNLFRKKLSCDQEEPGTTVFAPSMLSPCLLIL